MTSTAAATRTLLSPRRRTDGPAARERRFDIQMTVIAVIASIVSFVDRDWLTPGEPVAAAAPLVGLWVVALARTIARGDRTNFSEEHDEPR